MKRGELIILWVGGLLTVANLVGVALHGAQARDVYPTLILILAIWIICGLVWLTLYGGIRNSVCEAYLGKEEICRKERRRRKREKVE
jgi:hypothetical protein